MPEVHDEIAPDKTDDVTLRPLVQALWRRRRTMLLAFAAVILVFVGSVLVAFAMLPREVFASLGFRLTFEGVEQDMYPNGTKFSSGEIISTTVLDEVFKKNELQRYMQFSDFKDAIFLLQANPDIEMLAYEYQAKLADTRLNPVDRSRVEEEFRKKRESLKSAAFSLNLRRSERLTSVPPAVLNKILQETLSIWAQHAADRKGATRYNIAILSKNALRKEFVAGEEHIVAVDMLRTTIERVLKTTEDIGRLPGAAAVRLGEAQVSLADLRSQLEDTVRFKVEPLIGLIRTNGLWSNAMRADGYFSDRLLEVQRSREEVKQRITSMEGALRAYQQRGGADLAAAAGDRTGGLTPQVSESFIDRLVQLSTQANDVEYRQNLTTRMIEEGATIAALNRQVEYYQSMRAAFASQRQSSNPALEADVRRRTEQLYTTLGESLDQVGALFRLVSQQNLNPDTILYSITSPFMVRTTSALAWRTVMFYLALTLFAAIILIPLACLAADYFTATISERYRAAPRA
jgi:hypothetical protein